jgi:glycosyltransferase involved in cell wall biosynthesis
MPQPPTLSVVIPIHNEAGYLPEALPRLTAELESLGTSYEVILAENGSTDGTGRVAADLARTYRGSLRILNLPDPDYGAAMRAGFRQAAGEWVVNFDIDYFSGNFLRAALALADSADVVLASKRAPGADDRRGALRRMGTRVFNLLLRFLFRSSVSDTHGMKMVRRRVVEALAPRVISNRDLFDTELVIRAERAGYRIAEVPAVVEEQRAARSSFLRRVPRTIRGLIRIRWALWRRG